MNYKLLPDYLGQPANVVLKIGETTYPMSISCDPANTDYQEYLAWLAEGNEPIPADNSVTWDTIREKRDQLIRESDWTMIPGATVDQAAWAAYRQVLRDLPQTFAAKGPESVIWPSAPSTSGPNTTDVE